jgi:dihydrodipicolinate synthase/N-acetylneuraminate lyase
MRGIRLGAPDIRGVYAIVPTPATPEGSRWDAEFTVDVEESARAVRALLADGIDGIITTGTFGECATLTDEEWRTFVAAVCETAAGRVPVVVGAQTLNTRTTIARMRFARDRGAAGTMLGRPMWCELSPDGILEFYRAVAEAVPELGIVTYDNAFAFRGRLTPALYARLADIPQMAGAKYVSIDGVYRACVEAVRGRMRLMPIEAEWLFAAQWQPEEAAACWSSSACCHPLPSLRLRDHLRSGDAAAALALTRRMAWAYEPLYPKGGDWHEFSIYNIPLEKIRIDAAGYMRAGPARPPYHVIPATYADGARENGRRWRALAEELRAAPRP